MTNTEVRDMAFDMTDALTSPIITYDQSWADCIPQRIKNIIPTARLMALRKKQELATYPEVAAYLYTRAAVAPMDQEWTDIYCYVTCAVCKHYFNEDRFKELQVPLTLTRYLNDMLRDLRLKIYNKRRQILKQSSNDNTINT